MTNYDDLKFAVEAMSGGKNTVILDDLGKPSIMVSVPKMTYSDIIDGGSSEVLPCFIVDGEELDQIWVSKYHNIVVDDRAYSLPNQDPETYIDNDRAVEVCRNKGDGWCLMPNGLWGAVQGWCYRNEFIPHGNGYYGQDYTNSHEKGVCSYSDNGVRTCRTGTGTGPATWNHDGTTAGIADLHGNVWDWTSGMRLVDGEIQIIPEGNCMKGDCDLSETSTEWRAILPDGTLVMPSTAGTLKYDAISTANYSDARIDTTVNISTGDSNYARMDSFNSLTVQTGVKVPDILYALGLAPMEGVSYGAGRFYMRNSGERLPIRGASFINGSAAGLPALSLDGARSRSAWNVGFRSAFYGKL